MSEGAKALAGKIDESVNEFMEGVSPLIVQEIIDEAVKDLVEAAEGYREACASARTYAPPHMQSYFHDKAVSMKLALAKWRTKE